MEHLLYIKCPAINITGAQFVFKINFVTFSVVLHSTTSWFKKSASTKAENHLGLRKVMLKWREHGGVENTLGLGIKETTA